VNDYKLPNGKALVLRTCERKDDGTLTGHGNFPWPAEIGATVEAPDWSPEPNCGSGLHGLLWGTGDPTYLNRDVPAYMAVEIDESDAVWIGNDKVKFPRCTVVYVGDLTGAATLITKHAPSRSWQQDKARSLSFYEHRSFVLDPQHRSGCPEGCDSDYDECPHVDPAECVEVPVGPISNIISSELTPKGVRSASMFTDWDDSEPLHTVAIDIDHAVRVVPSTTEGHFHLYIDVPMPWRKYRRILKALRNAGVIESGYYSAAVARRATFLRLPWIRKPKVEVAA
jgi:hypothetical protein